MEIKPYFNNIRQEIRENLIKSKHEIFIAMAWFTNHEIFDILLEKANKISVNLIVMNDDINTRLDGLDFQKFIDLGGKFYFGKSGNPMHNKFCIIDSNTLITGSYNYTYLAESINDENIIVFKGPSDIINDYKSEFEKIISNLSPIISVSEYLELNPFQKDSFSFNNYGIRDIYQHSHEMKSLGLVDEAETLLKKLELKSELTNTNNFIIKDVIYRQWRQDYYTDKIQVLDNTLILYYRTISGGEGCWIHGPKTNHAWTLRSSKDKNVYSKANRITNIKIAGVKTVHSTDNEEIFCFSKKEKFDAISSDLGYKINDKKQPVKENGELVPITVFKIDEDKYELSCEIHFYIENFPLETVDLIEGLGAEERDNHWHCFDINLKLNREKL
jgi:hypothetical protein